MTKGGEGMRSQRRRDFEFRAASEPHGAMPLAAGGQIVTIHPLADELDILSKLNLRPEQCTSVDGYWSIGGDVVFLQVNTAIADSFREPGLYARLAPHPPRYVNLVVVVDEPYITRAMLENAAREFLRLGWDEAALGHQLIKLT